MNVGRIFVGLLILAGLVGTVTSGASFYPHMFVLGALLVIGARFQVAVLARSIRLTRQPEFWRAGVGDIFKEQYEIRNTSRLGGGWVEVHNQMQLPYASGSRLLPRLQAKDKQSFVARTWLTRRGGFLIGPTLVTVSDALGLFRAKRLFPAERSLLVLPMVFPIRGFLAPPGFLLGGHVIRRTSMDVTPHAAGVRSYVPGDPMKRIHWPTTARRGQIMVKEFEQDPQAEVWIFLDAERTVQAKREYETPAMPLESLLFSRKPKLTLPPSTLEYGISMAASLARYFIDQGRAVGLVLQDRAHAILPPERSQRQEMKILETLAFVEGQGNLSISALVGAHAGLLPQGSTAILLSPTTAPGLLMVADDLQRRNLRPVVILLSAASFDGRPGSEELGRRLSAQGVPVRQVACGADLAEALSSFFPTGISSQDGRPWQRPALSHLT